MRHNCVYNICKWVGLAHSCCHRNVTTVCICGDFSSSDLMCCHRLFISPWRPKIDVLLVLLLPPFSQPPTHTHQWCRNMKCSLVRTVSPLRFNNLGPYTGNCQGARNNGIPVIIFFLFHMMCVCVCARVVHIFIFCLMEG